MIFRYPGGKSRKSVREQIKAYFPPDYQEFRDVMVGGGGIFFAIPQVKRRWINDLDDHLISVYRALQERPEEFIAKCRQIQPQQKEEALASTKANGRALYNARLKEVFETFSRDDTIDPALRYFFIHRTVWGGRVNYNIASRLYFSNPGGWNIVATKKLELAAETIRDTKVTCGNYEEAILTEGEGVLVYIDPPYFKNTFLAPNSRLYRHNFELEDHERLAAILNYCPHKFVLSYDDHPTIRELYENFNVHKATWKYSGTSSALSEQTEKVKKDGRELIITNF